jgi:GH24 family phage-related lysozyme (muramidase)
VGAGEPRDTIGMTAEEMQAYLDALLQEEAAEAAAERGTSVEEELNSVGFAAARSASSYAIKLIDANNAYIARYLLDRGVFSQES